MTTATILARAARPLVARLALLLFAALFGADFATGTRALAAPIRFEARLIWGTDGPKPTTPTRNDLDAPPKDKLREVLDWKNWGTEANKPPLKDIDAALLEKLRGVFKWKNYFEVNRTPLIPDAAGVQRAVLSEKAEIVVRELENSLVEISLFGEGKCVTKLKQPFTGNVIIIAGDDKNKTAWFVILTPQVAK